MQIFVVSRYVIPYVLKSGSYHGFNCYLVDQKVYEKRVRRGWVFTTAEGALNFMIKEGAKYKYV